MKRALINGIWATIEPELPNTQLSDLQYWVFGWCQKAGNAPEWCKLASAPDLDSARRIATLFEHGSYRTDHGQVLNTKIEHHPEGETSK